MTGLEIFFNPSARHVQEERERAHTAVDDADSGDPPFGVDLDRMTVRLPHRGAASPEPADGVPAEPAPEPTAEPTVEPAPDPAGPGGDRGAP